MRQRAKELKEQQSAAEALQSVLDKIASPGGNVARLVQTKGLGDEKLCDELYLRVLCRFPTDRERGIVLKHLKRPPSDVTKPNPNARLEAAQDVVWALLNSREFLFNH